VFVLFVSFVAIEHAYKQLVSAIITGTMGNGKRLPTEAQLVDKLRVARRGNCAREPGAPADPWRDCRWRRERSPAK
jgi:hypothetical protein